MKSLLIIGASGHGKVVADIAKKTGYDKICFLDDNEALTECGGYPVVGKSDSFLEHDCDMIVAIGNAEVRQRLQERLEAAGKTVQTLLHPNVVIGEHVEIGNGSVVMAGAVINPGTTIGKGCIVNTCASVDHDCVVEDYVHISVGAHLAGTVCIGRQTWIGAGAVVNNNINVVGKCIVGSGAVVVRDLEVSGTYIGVPAVIKEDNISVKFGGGVINSHIIAFSVACVALFVFFGDAKIVLQMKIKTSFIQVGIPPDISITMESVVETQKKTVVRFNLI